MTSIGQPYRPAGTLDLRSILITTILGVTAAVIGAAVFWLWEWSPIPTLVVLTPIIQGLCVGGVMAFAVGRLRMRNHRLIATVGFTCGLLSITLVHYGHYLSMVTAAAGDLRERVAQDKTMPEAQRQAFLAQLDADPTAVIDAMLVKMTGHSGFLGSLVWRNEQGVMIKNRKESGTALWVLWGFEALIAALTAASVPASVASRPFCEECGYWCVGKPELFTLPAVLAEPLVQAVRDDNPARVAELRANPPPYDKSGLVGVALHACPGCDLRFATLTHRFVKGKETKVKVLGKLLHISPGVAAAMGDTSIPGAPAPEDVAGEPSEGPVADEGGEGQLADEPRNPY